MQDTLVTVRLPYWVSVLLSEYRPGSTPRKEIETPKKSAEWPEPASARRAPALLAGADDGDEAPGPTRSAGAPKRRALPLTPPSGGPFAGVACCDPRLDAGAGGAGDNVGAEGAAAHQCNLFERAGRRSQVGQKEFRGCRRLPRRRRRSSAARVAVYMPRQWSRERPGGRGWRAGLATCAAAALSATPPSAGPRHPHGWAAFRRPQQVPRAI